jgi:hypothetical protein
MLAAVLLLGTTVISGLSTANAENKNHEDKVKLDCLQYGVEPVPSTL